MSSPDRPPAGASSAPSDPEHDALLTALDALLRPLARLAIAEGLPCSTVEAALRLAFVNAAREALAHTGQPAHRLVSRISTTTGLNRREVTRLTQSAPETLKPSRDSVTSEVFTRWMTDPAFQPAPGAPRVLPRQGEAASFESLARSVTQDVHPRSILDELCRLGLAALSADEDTVTLLKDAFVPQGDSARMLGFLGDNVGDHFEAAVDNVTGDGRRHLDQAVFADELSAQSLQTVHDFAQRQWQRLLDEAVPLLERCIEEDRAAGRTQDQRVRIGLYAYDQPMSSASPSAGDPPPAAEAAPHKKARKRTS